jgi:adhesin/invasin
MRFLLLPLVCVVFACSGNDPSPGDSGSLPPDATKSAFTVSPATAVADGTAGVSITATVLDANGSGVRNVLVKFQVSGTGNQFNDQSMTNQDGVATTMLSSRKAEPKTVTAKVVNNGVETAFGQDTTVTFVAGPPENVAFKVQPGLTRAGLAISPAVELQMLDRNNNPTSGNEGSALVRLVRSSGGTVSNGGMKTAVNGVIRFDNLIINRPQTGYALRAEAMGGGAAESVLFDVVLGDLSAATSTFTPVPANVVADGTSTSVLTLTARDTGGNTLANQAVSLSVSGTGHTLGAATGLTDGAGVFSTTLSATTAGARTVTATIGAASLNTTVTFIP